MQGAYPGVEGAFAVRRGHRGQHRPEGLDVSAPVPAGEALLVAAVEVPGGGECLLIRRGQQVLVAIPTGFTATAADGSAIGTPWAL